MNNFVYNYPVRQHFGKGCAEEAIKTTVEQTAALGIDALEAFIREIGLPTRWSEMGITDERVLRAAADTCFITPGCCRRLTRDEIFEILKECM